MAFPYPKPDPATGKLRWFARIKIGTKFETVSLRLLAPENRRIARDRANRLQVECDTGVFSAETREWLSDRTVRRLEQLRQGIRRPTADVRDWQSAMTAYLAAKAPGDTRTHFEGKAVAAEEHSRVNRTHNVRRFVEWANAQRLAFPGDPITDVLIRYFAERLKAVTPNTVRSADFPYLLNWVDWMARKGLCSPPDRPRIIESIPPRIAPDVTLPTWQEDLAALRYFHARRDAPVEGSTWRKPKGYHAIWGLILIVRGLGCRPSEAISLDWSTVRIDEGRVRFLQSKTGKHRTVPILWQWVADGLEELADRNGRVGAVCLSATGTPYTRETIAANLIRRGCLADQRPAYHLKTAQKLWIRQAIMAGFPPRVVARWADHGLSMQEQHYNEEDVYLPPADRQNYAEFSDLTEYGRRAKEHLEAFGRDFDLGARE